MFRKQKRLGNSKRRGRLRWMHGYPAPAKTTGAGGSGPERCRQILQQDPPLQHTGWLQGLSGEGRWHAVCRPIFEQPPPKHALSLVFLARHAVRLYARTIVYPAHAPARVTPIIRWERALEAGVFLPSWQRWKRETPRSRISRCWKLYGFPPDQAPSASFMRLTASGGASLAAISRNSASFRRCLTCGSSIGVVWPGSVSRS